VCRGSREATQPPLSLSHLRDFRTGWQGRVASHFYVGHKSMEEYNNYLKRHMSEADVFHMVAHSAEFENIVVRDEEMPELQTMARKLCPVQVASPPLPLRSVYRLVPNPDRPIRNNPINVQVKGGVENKIGKVNILLQAYISRARVESFSLTVSARSVLPSGEHQSSDILTHASS
jgi:activating signal cointegrator complex subunit 3